MALIAWGAAAQAADALQQDRDLQQRDNVAPTYPPFHGDANGRTFLETCANYAVGLDSRTCEENSLGGARPRQR